MFPHAPLPVVALAAILALPDSARAAEADGHPHESGAQPQLALSLVLDPRYTHDNQDGEGGELVEEAAGILHGTHFREEAHGAESGFSLGASELAVEAELPSLLTARVSVGLLADEIRLEDAWVQTQGLPAGLAVRAGRFLSGIGYLNSQHLHEQDFVGGNLVYGALLGDHGVFDTGVQLTWQAPVPFYLQFGVEALQGHEQERFGTLINAGDADGVVLSGAGLSEKRQGPRSGAFFVKAAPYLGEAHSLQIGASWAGARQFQQVIDEDDTVLDDQFALEGKQTLLGLDAVYERNGDGKDGAGGLTLAAEYLWLEKDMKVRGADAGAPVLSGDVVKGRQDGVYVQALYGVAPRWQLGLRHEVTGLQNELDEGDEALTFDESARTSMLVVFRPNAGSRLRLQLSSADIHDEEGEKTRLEQLTLGYTVVFGSHRGHAH